MSSVMNKVGIFALWSLITVFWIKLSCILFFMNALWQLEIMKSRLGAQVCWQRERERGRDFLQCYESGWSVYSQSSIRHQGFLEGGRCWPWPELSTSTPWEFKVNRLRLLKHIVRSDSAGPRILRALRRSCCNGPSWYCWWLPPPI